MATWKTIFFNNKTTYPARKPAISPPRKPALACAANNPPTIPGAKPGRSAILEAMNPASTGTSKKKAPLAPPPISLNALAMGLNQALSDRLLQFQKRKKAQPRFRLLQQMEAYYLHHSLNACKSQILLLMNHLPHFFIPGSFINRCILIYGSDLAVPRSSEYHGQLGR